MRCNEHRIREIQGTWSPKSGAFYQQLFDQLFDVGCGLCGLFASCQFDQSRQKVSTLFHVLQRLLRAQNIRFVSSNIHKGLAIKV